MKMMTILAAHHEAVMMTYAWYSDNHRSESLSDGLDDGSPDWNWYGEQWWSWWWQFGKLMEIIVGWIISIGYGVRMPFQLKPSYAFKLRGEGYWWLCDYVWLCLIMNMIMWLCLDGIPLDTWHRSGRASLHACEFQTSEGEMQRWL